MFRKAIISLLVVSLALSSVQPAQAAIKPSTNASLVARGLESLPAAAQTVFRDMLLNAPAASSTSGAAATSATGAAVPTPLTKPLVLARVQSAYTPSGMAGGTLIITYTVVNRLPLDELSGAEVTVKLAAGVTLVSGPAHLTLADGSLSFALGEVGPADGASVAIVVSAPAAPGNLDMGARASASFANQRVTAQTAPARLVSDAYAPFLGQQPEFMFNDVDLLEVAGLVEQDAAQAFALVRDATRWEAYRGSLRGARGTWWSEAGNALDRSSLLLGVLRTIGVPSRYVRGTLDAARQRALIGQMFEDSASQMGVVPPENQYDPYGDARLLGIAGDHWWVEADLGSGWQALDANFRNATIGALFGAGGQVVSVIPDADRHWTKIDLTVEKLPALTGPAGKLETFKAFELTLPTAQIAGLPTVIGHFVRSKYTRGAVAYAVLHYYTPFIAVGGIRPEATIYRGDEYFESITSVSLANQRVTAASFDVTIWGPGAGRQTYKDEIVDRIGKLARQQGGTMAVPALSTTEPIVQDKQSVSLFVAPTWVPERAVARAAGRTQRQLERAQEASYLAQQVIPSGMPQTPEQDAAIGALDGELALVGLQVSIVNGLSAMQDADRGTRQYAETGRVKAYYATPRLLASALDVPELDANTVKARMNLMRRDIALTPYPGQDESAVYGVRMAHGIRAMTSEYLTLGAAASPSDTVKSAIGVMDMAMRQGIGYTLLTPDRKDRVQALNVSDDARARILEALDRGRVVMTPQRAPSVRGETYLAWFEMNMQTGEVEDQDEDGNRAVIVEYLEIHEGWKTKKCGPPKPETPDKPNCKNADARYAFIGFVSGLATRLYIWALSRLIFLDYYLLSGKNPELIEYIHQACEGYLNVVGKDPNSDRAKWDLRGWGRAKGKCSAKDVANFFDALVWFVMSFFIRFFREGLGADCADKSLFGLLEGGNDEADVFWGGLTMLGVKFWVNKCNEFAAKFLTFEIRGSLDLYSKLFSFESIDPFKQVVDETFLPMLATMLNEDDQTDALAASFGPTFISYDASGVKERLGGFDHGAAVAGLVVKNVLNKDPEVPPGVVYNAAAPVVRPLEANRPVTPVVSYGPSTSGAFNTPHARLRQTGNVVVSGGALALAGGRLTAGGAQVFDHNGALLHAGSVVIELNQRGGALSSANGDGVAQLSGARDVALWAEGASVRGQAVLTAAHRVLLQAGGSMMLTLGAGAVVNAVSRTQPVRVVFNTAEWREGQSLAWRDAASVSWTGGVALMQFGAVNGAIGDASNVGAASLAGWSGSASAVASGGALNLTLSGTGGALLSAEPAWSSDSQWWYLEPNVRSNQANTYTLAARMDADQVLHELDVAGPGATVRVSRQPDRLAAEVLRGQLALRDGTQRTVLLVDTGMAVPARAPSLSVSVAQDELNKHIWGDFPYYTVMGMLHNVLITYTGDAPRVFDLTVEGLPAGWGVLSRERVALDKGQTVGVGLIISPPVGALPLPGTTIPFTVRVRQAGGGLSASGQGLWRAPGTGLPGLMFDPNVRTEVAPTETIVARLFVFNGGAITDTFLLTAGSNVKGKVTARAPESVRVGAADVATVPVTVTMRAEVGTLVPVAAMAAPRAAHMYTRTAMTHLRFAIVPVEDVPLYDQAYRLRGPGCQQHLAHATYLLAQALSFYRLNKVPLSEVTVAQERLRNALACFDETGIFTGTQAISAALTLVPTQTQPLVDALNRLGPEIRQALDYRAELSIAPALSAVRLNRPVTLPVVLAHAGRVSGTFTLVVTDAGGTARTFRPFLAPGERFTHTVVFTPMAEGEYTVSAAASAPVPQVRPRALARVLAYERLVDILAVKGTPGFVETGSGASALSVDVVNHTPLPQVVTVALTMTAPGGEVHYTRQVIHALERGVTTLPMGTATFMNAAEGVYALRAELVGEGRAVVGGVNAGTGILVTTSSAPLTVPPGDVTATTWITTERRSFGDGSVPVGRRVENGVDITLTLMASMHAGGLLASGPVKSSRVTVPPGIYDIVYVNGAVRFKTGGQWYGQVDIIDSSSRKYYILGHAANTALGSDHPFVGGLPTMQAASAYHAGRFIRIRVTDTTPLLFYIYATNLRQVEGWIRVRVTQVGHLNSTLRQRVETAIHHSVPRMGLDSIEWDIWTGASTDAHRSDTANRNCNGCHVQAQGMAGLAAVNAKLRPSAVDERVMEWLSLRLRGWQDGSGRVDGHGGSNEYRHQAFQRTVVPVWGWAEQLRMQTRLGRAPDPALKNALLQGVDWLLSQPTMAGLWYTDRDEFPWQNVVYMCGFSDKFSPMTTYFMMSALRVAYDLTGDPRYLSRLTNAARSMSTIVDWRRTCGGERYPYYTAPAMLGLQEALDVINDPALAQMVRNKLATFEEDLRTTQQLTPGVTANDGGWRMENKTNGVNNPSDPYVTAMALYALARQGARSTDINLLRAAEFLLNKQDWNYRDNRFTVWRVGRWYSMYGRRTTPIGPTTWVDFALPLIYERIASYSMDVLHDTPAHARVLTPTFNLPPRSTIALPNGERRAWFYNQPETMRRHVISYTSTLTRLRPGEVRSLTLGTLVTYTIESGSNRIALPGAYVQAVKLVQITPPVQVVGAGQTAHYTLTLNNPLNSLAVYNVTLSGLEDYAVERSFVVNVPANSRITRGIVFTVPAWAVERQHAVRVEVNNGQDSDHALLQVVRDVAIALTPAQQITLAGRIVRYTVVVTNLSRAASVVDVVGALSGGAVVTLARGLSLPPAGARVLVWALNAPPAAGSYALRVEARGGRSVPSASGQLEVKLPALSAALGNATTGSGMPAVLTSTVTQAAAELPGAGLPGARITVQAPAGWQVLQVPMRLPPGRDLAHGDVIVLPPAGTPAGVYDVRLTAVLTGYPQVTAQAVGRVTVLNSGVAVKVSPLTQTVATGNAFQFNVVVTNTGAVASRFVVAPTGLLALHGSLAQQPGGGNEVNLPPGRAARFLWTGQATEELPGGLHPAAVQAQSLSDARVRAVDYGWLVVNGRPALEAQITPTYQLVEMPDAQAWLLLKNLGSSEAGPVRIEVAGADGAAVHVFNAPYGWLMPQGEGAMRMALWLPGPGLYVVTATVTTPGAVSAVVTTATVEYLMAAMSMEVADGETFPGQSATLPVSVTYMGAQALSNLSVQVSVPEGPWALNDVSAENGPVTVTLPMGAVERGTTVTGYAIRPLAPLPYGAEQITATVTLLFNGEARQSAEAHVRVRAPDFRASTLMMEVNQEFLDDVMTYTWRLRNTGDADALGVRAVVTLPAHDRFEWIRALSMSGGRVTWDGVSRHMVWEGDLPIGAEVEVGLLAVARFGLPQGEISTPFEVNHPWRVTNQGLIWYNYPYRVYFMLVRNNAP